MKNIFKVFLYFFIIVIALSGMLVYLGWLPFVIPSSGDEPKLDYTFQKGDTLSPLSNFNFVDGDWHAFVVFDYADQASLPPSIPKAACLHTDDKILLGRMKENWRFIVTGGDMATVTSRFYLQKDGKIVFRTGIVLDTTSQGFQSIEFGWIKPVNGYNIGDEIKEFNRVWSIFKIL